MAKLKRLVDSTDHLVEIEVPVTDEELHERKELYEKLPGWPFLCFIMVSPLER